MNETLPVAEEQAKVIAARCFSDNPRFQYTQEAAATAIAEAIGLRVLKAVAAERETCLSTASRWIEEQETNDTLPEVRDVLMNLSGRIEKEVAAIRDRGKPKVVYVEKPPPYDIPNLWPTDIFPAEEENQPQ